MTAQVLWQAHRFNQSRDKREREKLRLELVRSIECIDRELANDKPGDAA